MSGFGSSKCTNSVRRMYSKSERLHFGGRHLKNTVSAPQMATLISSCESSKRFSNSGYTSRSCSLLISACSSESVAPNTKHAIFLLSGENESSRQLFKTGSRSAKTAFNAAGSTRCRPNNEWIHMMPPFRILLLDCPALQTQFGMITSWSQADVCSRIAAVSVGSSWTMRKWTRPRMSIRAATEASSGDACRASAGTNALMCSAAAAPEFRRSVSSMWRFGLRSSQSSMSAPRRISLRRVRRCSSYNSRLDLPQSPARLSIHTSTAAESHSLPERMRSNKSKMRGHTPTQPLVPERSNAWTVSKTQGKRSSLVAPSSSRRMTMWISPALRRGGAARDTAGGSKCANTAYTCRLFSMLTAMKFRTPCSTSCTVRVTSRPRRFSGQSSSTPGPFLATTPAPSTFKPRCFATRPKIKSMSRKAPSIAAHCNTARATVGSSSAEALYK
mmetsp:Transcript_62879/g.175213  ORF Transcript_62879/g.175213 Transcript_62879/m.175213 type:complete len:444 (+) Transcript_62879:392-1723(+)